MLKVTRLPLLNALLCFCANWAVAQTAPSSKPTEKPSTPFIPMTVVPTTPSSISTSKTATATLSPLRSGEIYRWTDRLGRVQYGTLVPEEFSASGRKVDTRGNIVSSRVPASIGAASPRPAAADEPAVGKPKHLMNERERCEAAWKQYNEAQACFAQYRQATVGGAGKKSGSNASAEAQEKCQSFTEPAPCR
jgi:hypothetical protein